MSNLVQNLMRHLAIVLIVLAVSVQTAFSQRLKFRSVTTDDGLSSSQVKCLMQDDLGFMWFGTGDGLNRYDGYKFRVFRNDPVDPNSLLSSDITAIIQVRHNLILAGTAIGIACFDPVTEKFTHPFSSDGRLNQKINTIYQLDENTVLAGTTGGLFRLDMKTNKVLRSYYPDLLKVNISSIIRSDNKIYVATAGNGLWMIDRNDKIIQVELSGAGLPAKTDLFQLRDLSHLGEYGGKLYAGTRSGSVFKIDRDHELLAEYGCAPAGEVRDFIFWNNHLYCATTGGLVVHNLLNGRVTRYSRQEQSMGLGSDLLRCIFADEGNNFWIGTDDAGVAISLFRSQKFPISLHQVESQFRDVFAINSAVPGQVIVGGKNTLAEIDLASGKITALNGKLKDYTVMAVAVESPRWIWAGTTAHGLLRIDRTNGQVSTLIEGITAPDITSLKIRDSMLYAGSLGSGLFAVNLQSGKVQQYTETDGLPELNINSIYIDSKRRVWLSSSGGGVLRLAAPPSGPRLQVEKIFRNTGKASQLASNTVFSVLEDDKSQVWLATAGGLSRMLPGDTFHNYYNKDGLANTFLYSLLKDSTGRIWCSSNGGLISFDPSAPVKEVIFKNYNLKDGLLSNEFLRGSAFYDGSGTMYFGGPAGFNMFRPSQIKDNFHAPEVLVTGYTRAGVDIRTDTSITFKKHLRIGWEENHFQFEFSAIDYTDPSRNKFRYMLEGYDSNWSSPSVMRYVSYNDLPGGTYTLQVKASNNDGIWNEKPLQLVITIVPPFWRTKTFYLLVVLVLFGTVYLYTRIRTRAVMRENRILELKVAERTRELEQKNRDITSSIEYAKRIQEAILPPADHIFARLHKAFIFYKPKDIVSGDFYWFSENRGRRIFAVVDCTGHGVPGAFMSMIGHNLLHQVVNEKGITDPGAILDHLHKGVNKALRQGQNDVSTNDGMDVSLIVLGPASHELSWAGANRPLVVIDPDRNLKRYEGDKMPVGGAQFERVSNFKTHTIDVEPGSMCYMFTDGYADQFGGEKGKKFMVRRFHDLLTEIHLLSPGEQKQALHQTFEDWRQNHEQVDDVLIAGITV